MEANLKRLDEALEGTRSLLRSESSAPARFFAILRLLSALTCISEELRSPIATQFYFLLPPQQEPEVVQVQLAARRWRRRISVGVSAGERCSLHPQEQAICISV